MRLRSGLLNEDVADRFDISPTNSSFIFTTLITSLTKLLKSVVALLPRGAIRDNFPESFIKTGNNKCRVILWAEVFTERPKPLDCQAASWSDYKHHITIKFLVAISPSGFTTFLISCYGSRVSVSSSLRIVAFMTFLSVTM